MKSFNRTIIAFIAVNLTIATFTLAKENTEAKKQTFTISGSVGLPGVIMKGLPGNFITDENGNYSAAIEHGWSGTVTPVKEGYVFDPPSRSYSQVTANQINQDYAASVITFTISGSVSQEGVFMTGLPENPVTDVEGNYSAAIPYSWAGRVTPRKEGFIFTPPTKTYNPIRRDQTNQNYVSKPIMLNISDVIAPGGNPIAGVRVLANNGGASTFTDAQGRYSVPVPYGWSGEITASKEGFVFDPPSKSYTNVTTDIIDGKPQTPSGRWEYLSGRSERPRRTTTETGRRILGRAERRKVLVIPATDVNAADIDAITQDLQVMSHILDGKFTERRQIAGVFTDFGDFFGRDNRETEAIYIQDYGVLFLMEVNFTFSPPQPQEKQEEQTEKQPDPTWQRAQRELFSPERPGNIPGGFVPAGGYNAQMVEELKTELIRTLKHAANIRSIEADEWVILNVTGTSQRPIVGYSGDVYGGGGGLYGGGGMGGYGGSGGYGYGGGYAGGGYGGYGGFGFGMGGGTDSSPMEFTSSTVLTIRAKKSDIDAFAKSDIDLEQFQKKVNILMY